MARTVAARGIARRGLRKSDDADHPGATARERSSIDQSVGGELQVVVNFAYFSKDRQLGHPMTGWGRVALISDLSQVLPAPAPQRAEELHRVWQAIWQGVGEDEASVDRIPAEIDRTRETIREILRRLD